MNFSALLALCAGNSPVTGKFPSQRPVTRSFDVFCDLRLINAWVNTPEAGDLRRHRAHYDLVVALESIYRYHCKQRQKLYTKWFSMQIGLWSAKSLADMGRTDFVMCFDKTRTVIDPLCPAVITVHLVQNPYVSIGLLPRIVTKIGFHSEGKIQVAMSFGSQPNYLALVTFFVSSNFCCSVRRKLTKAGCLADI